MTVPESVLPARALLGERPVWDTWAGTDRGRVSCRPPLRPHRHAAQAGQASHRPAGDSWG